jgi:hypothetical protein
MGTGPNSGWARVEGVHVAYAHALAAWESTATLARVTNTRKITPKHLVAMMAPPV